jgi:hypothetical protein
MGASRLTFVESRKVQSYSSVNSRRAQSTVVQPATDHTNNKKTSGTNPGKPKKVSSVLRSFFHLLPPSFLSCGGADSASDHNRPSQGNRVIGMFIFSGGVHLCATFSVCLSGSVVCLFVCLFVEKLDPLAPGPSPMPRCRKRKEIHKGPAS